MAIQYRHEIERLVVSPELLTNLAGQRLVKRLRIAGTPCTRLTPDQFATIAHALEPQGVAALVRQRWQPLSNINLEQGGCRLVLESLRSPGNLGSIVRSCHAAGAGGVILLDDGVDCYDPAAARASMGSLFAVEHTQATLQELLAWKRVHGVAIVGAAIDAKYDYRELNYPERCLIALGCERKGLSSALRMACDSLVRIPMVSSIDSLNVSVAAGLLLYEVYR